MRIRILDEFCKPRSGNSLTGIDVKLGTIDVGFIGEVSVILKNDTWLPRIIHRYDRIAQLVVVKMLDEKESELEIVDFLDETLRGPNCFGSTKA